MSSDSASAVRAMIADLVANPARHRWGSCAEHAKRFDALPVHGNFGGYLLVAPEGRVLCVPDDPAESVRDASATESLLARAEAARLYPRLAALRPMRPPHALDCDECRGRGHHGRVSDVANAGGYVHEDDLMLCGYCSSLGWIDPARVDAA